MDGHVLKCVCIFRLIIVLLVFVLWFEVLTAD